MKRAIGRMAMIAAVGMAANLAAVSGVQASDIHCGSPSRGSSVHCEDPQGAGTRCTLETDGPRQNARKQHLICDSATLSARYERLYAEQQRMLRKGTLQDADVTAWRVRRDACESVRCLESMFAKFWRERETLRNAPARPPAPPPAAAAASNPVAHEPAPAALPTPPAQEVPASAEPLATQAKAEPAEPARPTAASPEPPDVGQEAAPYLAKNDDSSPGNRRSAALALESLFSGLAVLGIGAGFLWTRRTGRAQDGPRSAIPAAMVIAYGLLLVNALMLPFTLGLN